MKVTHHISFDLQKHGKRQIIYVKQGDELSREIAFSIYNDGTVWTVPADVTIVQFAYCKSDHIGGCYDKMPDDTDAGSFNDSRTVITMQIHPQVLNVAGNVICELRLLNSDGQILNSFNFYVSVEGSPIAMTSASEGYYNNVFDGATFTPNIDANGILSWTNDKGLPNPPEVNLGIASRSAVLYTEQTLADDQMAQARKNIGAIGANDIYAESIQINTPSGVTDVQTAVNRKPDWQETVLCVEQDLTDEQKAQARENIGAVSEKSVGAMIANAIGDTAGALAEMDNVIGGAGA